MPAPDHHDIRMRGFAQRTTVAAAWEWVDQMTQSPLGSEQVLVADAAGRILAKDVTSSLDVPSFDRAMMDGYALQAVATAGAGSYQPMMFEIVGDSFPGKPFGGEVRSGQAIRIMTGAPLPRGADAVLPAEHAAEEAGRLSAFEELTPGKHVGRRGEDIAAGMTILSRGRSLRPQDIGLLSSIGCGEVEVFRRPRVRILVTGNELLSSDSLPQSASIFDANGPMLAALATRDGGCVQRSPIVPDEPAAIRAALEEDADVTLVSGGSSVGLEDHAPRILSQLGTVAIHGVAMRPSSPVGMGTLGNRLVFLLPGNPVSCLCAYDFFAGRSIRRWGGRPAHFPYVTRQLPLARKLVSQIGRVDYARVKIVAGQVEPIAISGASLLRSTTDASGFVIIPADLEGYAAGERVTIYLYDGDA